jgi:aryl-alcohol dehydrogenase-like predicted oxidoreductase
MDVEALDLLQFHWWEYRDLGYLEALRHMADLQQAGKIKHLALTNFDTEHLKIILENGIKIVSNQVQFSLIDRRPEVQMLPFCQQHGIQLFAYGSIGGGLLSEKYLGAREPGRYDLPTASLRKYQQMIKTWGDWSLFQELLTVLSTIAQKHRVSIANVAVRYVLDRPAVAGVIVGARLGVAEHITDTAQAFGLNLDAADLAQIEAVLGRSRNLFEVIGDCGNEYRR